MSGQDGSFISKATNSQIVLGREVKQRAAAYSVGVVGNVFAVGAFDHHDACVVRGRYDARRHIGEQRPHEAGMAQRIDRDLRRIKPDCGRHLLERPCVVALAPTVTVLPYQQWLIGGAAAARGPQLRRKTWRDRNRTSLHFPTAALSGTRHHEPRRGAVVLQILHFQAGKLTDARAGD